MVYQWFATHGIPTATPKCRRDRRSFSPSLVMAWRVSNYDAGQIEWAMLLEAHVMASCWMTWICSRDIGDKMYSLTVTAAKRECLLRKVLRPLCVACFSVGC